jgi:thymidylate synthase ThyX
MTIEAKVVCDSIGRHSPRLTTFWTRYPKFVHAEHMRHRTGSYCVSSSRAIPVSKNLEEVRSDELRAAPVWWGREQKGMASGEELDDVDSGWHDPKWQPRPTTHRQAAKDRWKMAALQAAENAEHLVSIGVHKSIVNRLLEPFLHVNVLVTSCEPGLLNFFGLRLDKAAQPEIRALAEAMWKAWNNSTPKKLKSGQWHLPLADDSETQETTAEVLYGMVPQEWEMNAPEVLVAALRKISTGRCARLSYISFETGRRSTVEEDLALYERLVGAHPIHASPAEHQATPDDPMLSGWQWNHPELHGNLPGWIQHRKLLPGEAVAPLPEGYACG